MKVNVITEHPIAFESRDHTHPHGTANDNWINPNFNRKLYSLMGNNRKLKVLDLGCAGGGFVKSVIDDGHFAIGLEGSDYSRIRKRAEWATIPDNLFTCDCTKPFYIYESDSLVKFDVVTAWEFIEHIEEGNIFDVCENVIAHLASDGIWIMSVSPNIEFHHRTTQPKEWWLKKFDEFGFVHDQGIIDNFGGEFVRGPQYGATNSFHLCLRVK